MSSSLNSIGTKTTAVVAVILRDDKVLLGSREYIKGSPVWTSPGGRCDEGETLEQTLRRETYEEVGIDTLEVKEYIDTIEGAKVGDTLHIYSCETTQDPTNKEPHKFIEWKWFTADEVPDNFISPQARQALMNFMLKRK